MKNPIQYSVDELQARLIQHFLLSRNLADCPSEGRSLAVIKQELQGTLQHGGTRAYTSYLLRLLDQMDLIVHQLCLEGILTMEELQRYSLLICSLYHKQKEGHVTSSIFLSDVTSLLLGLSPIIRHHQINIQPLTLLVSSGALTGTDTTHES